ncbi:MAG: hypothetical protein Q4B16_08730 [Bacteroidia bacterium]|nr:hypothetical protein [Bacteroidia bacterium]
MKLFFRTLSAPLLSHTSPSPSPSPSISFLHIPFRTRTPQRYEAPPSPSILIYWDGTLRLYWDGLLRPATPVIARPFVFVIAGSDRQSRYGNGMPDQAGHDKTQVGQGKALAAKALAAPHYCTKPLEGDICSSAAMHPGKVASEYEYFVGS